MGGCFCWGKPCTEWKSPGITRSVDHGNLIVRDTKFSIFALNLNFKGWNCLSKIENICKNNYRNMLFFTFTIKMIVLKSVLNKEISCLQSIVHTTTTTWLKKNLFAKPFLCITLNFTFTVHYNHNYLWRLQKTVGIHIKIISIGKGMFCGDIWKIVPVCFFCDGPLFAASDLSMRVQKTRSWDRSGNRNSWLVFDLFFV